MWVYELQMYMDALNARWNEWILGYGPENQDRFMNWLGIDDPDWQKKALLLLAWTMGLLFAVSVLMALRNRAPRRDRAAQLYSKFVKKSGVEPETGETPATFAQRLQAETTLPAEKVDEITNSYLEARYGPPDPTWLERLENAISSLRPHTPGRSPG
jgi:hypothetical protein